MTKFVMDSNFFIQAHRVTYPLDVAISFWKKIKEMGKSGAIISIDKVRNELYGQKDDLERWCRTNLPVDFFKDTTEFLAEYQKVLSWAVSMDRRYIPSAVNEFLGADKADAFLIAYTLADSSNLCIVTQEVSTPQGRSKIKIPDCCDALNVGMLRQLKCSVN